MVPVHIVCFSRIYTRIGSPILWTTFWGLVASDDRLWRRAKRDRAVDRKRSSLAPAAQNAAAGFQRLAKRQNFSGATERQFESAACGREYWLAATLTLHCKPGNGYRGAASRARKRNTIATSPLPPVLRRRSDATARTFKGWIFTDRGSRSTWLQLDRHLYRRGEGRGECGAFLNLRRGQRRAETG